MTEIQKVNETPLSQMFKELLFPYQKENSPYLFQWIQQAISLMEAWGYLVETSSLSSEELANLEALTHSEKVQQAFRTLLPPSDPLNNQSEILSTASRLLKAKSEPEHERLTISLLEMLAANAANSGADLTPSLHEVDR